MWLGPTRVSVAVDRMTTVRREHFVMRDTMCVPCAMMIVTGFGTYLTSASIALPRRIVPKAHFVMEQLRIGLSVQRTAILIGHRITRRIGVAT